MAEYKITPQNSVVFLYTNDKYIEKEIGGITFTIASEKLKYLVINLTRKIKELYNEHFKILKKIKKMR